MTLDVRLLGQVEMSRNGRPIAIRGSKPLALLAYLLMTGKSHTRQHLMDLFFDSPDDPKASLRWTLSELRQAIGADYILADRQQIAFNFDGDYWLDVTAFEAGQTDLYRGDFLEGLNVRGALSFEDWVLFERERLKRHYQAVLTRQLEAGENSGDDRAVIEISQQLLRLDNLCEEWRRALMRAYARQGQREAALAQFDLCRQLLQTELGVEPAAETVALVEAIRQGEIEVAKSPVPVHNLPPQPTPFIGREVELAEIIQRLTDPTCRLLTLVGPGGIGKTRLALAAAARLLADDAFPGGIYFVPLAAISSADFLVSTIAEPLNFSFQSGAEPKVQLLNFLGELKQPMLLVLDNFEQLLTSQKEKQHGGGELLLDILQTAPAVKLLVTSRERLNLRDEWLLDIRGLPFPMSLQSDALEGYGAVQLFFQTAARLEPTFALSEADKPFVARICQLVEGMPLGLELAAVWVRVLSCQEITREIEKSLEFLATSLRDVPARHRSLIAVFDHSWNHLSPEEQRVFRSLAVFRGGFSREAAQQVASASLLLLAALVDKSMLRRNDSGRYELHELLRQYGAEKLEEAGGTDQARGRHLEFFLTLAEEAEPKLQGAEQVSWLARLDTESGNLRAALAWSLAGGEAETGLRLAVALGQFWRMRGHRLSEGSVWLERVLAKTEASGPTTIRARAYRRLGYLTYRQGNHAAARSAYEKSLALYRKLGNKDGMADSLFNLGDIAAFQGDDVARSFYAEARSTFEDSLAILHERGDKWRLARSLVMLGELARAEGDYAAARSFYEESLILRRELGDEWGIANSLINLMYVACHQGEYRQAATLIGECLALCQKLGEKRGIVYCIAGFGYVAEGVGQPERATRLFGAAKGLREAIHVRLEYVDRIEEDRHINAVRAQLDEATFARNWAEGRHLTIEQAFQEALAVKSDHFGEDAG